MVTLAHSSDLHLCDYYEYGLWPIRSVISAADRAEAEVILLAGDVFENNRVPLDFVRTAVEVVARARQRFVILPGNHDPLTDEARPAWQLFADLDNVAVLGLSVPEAVRFPDLDLEVWGRAHRDYSDMDPLREPLPRSTRWQVVMAHGHYTDRHSEPGVPRASWLIYGEDIAATGADYVALGHWNTPERVGNGSVPAHYSGSPDLAQTINIVRLSDEGVQVTREPLDIEALELLSE